MTQYVAIFSGEYRKYWRQDQMGYTDHPKDFGWWPFEEAKKLIAGVGQEKKLELVPYQPSRLQIVLRQSRNYPPKRINSARLDGVYPPILEKHYENS